MPLSYSQRMAFTTIVLSLQRTHITIVIKLALTDATKEGGERFSLAWLRERSKLYTTACLVESSGIMAVRAHARKTKKQLGPRLNKSIECVLRNEVGCKGAFHVDLNRVLQAQLGYLDLQFGRRNRIVSIYLSAGGRHE